MIIFVTLKMLLVCLFDLNMYVRSIENLSSIIFFNVSLYFGNDFSDVSIIKLNPSISL